MSGPSHPKAPSEADGPELDAEAIDSGWDDTDAEEDVGHVSQTAPTSRPSRDRMATLHDDDPLRHDIGYRRERDPTRDSRPTLPVINPLQYDVEPESDVPGDDSGVRRRRR